VLVMRLAKIKGQADCPPSERSRPLQSDLWQFALRSGPTACPSPSKPRPAANREPPEVRTARPAARHDCDPASFKFASLKAWHEGPADVTMLAGCAFGCLPCGASFMPCLSRRMDEWVKSGGIAGVISLRFIMGKSVLARPQTLAPQPICQRAGRGTSTITLGGTAASCSQDCASKPNHVMSSGN
jgi:hypothetical protein